MPAEHSIPGEVTAHSNHCRGRHRGGGDGGFLSLLRKSVAVGPPPTLQEQFVPARLLGQVQQADSTRRSEADEAKRALGDHGMLLHTTARNFWPYDTGLEFRFSG